MKTALLALAVLALSCSDCDDDEVEHRAGPAGPAEPAAARPPDPPPPPPPPPPLHVPLVAGEDAGFAKGVPLPMPGGLPPEPPPGRMDAVTEETCVGRWLQARKLDPFGNPPGTMYAGGTPLFDETTGQMKDRLEYVYSRQPAAKTACRK